MYAQLPSSIQRKVLEYLSNNNFVAAKELHDAWLRSHTVNTSKHSHRKTSKPTSKPSEFTDQ